MYDSIRESWEMMRDQVWFFRIFLVVGIICVYRTLLQYVLRTNNCANPFCSKCLGNGTIRSRAIQHIKDNSDDDSQSLDGIVLTNLHEHERLLRRNVEKPTVYYHRGLSSGDVVLPKIYTDEQTLVEHYDELRQEIVKFLQQQTDIEWTNFDLFENGEENKDNCQRLPKLVEILQMLPNAICNTHPKCHFSYCALTRLPPNLAADQEKNKSGLTNCSIRLHLGLVCDENSAAFVLFRNRKRLLIENKRVIVYNDALEHSFVNPSQSQQIFLSIDLWHPDLATAMRTHLSSIFNSDLA